jgi:hypothetical protein
VESFISFLERLVCAKWRVLNSRLLVIVLLSFSVVTVFCTPQAFSQSYTTLTTSIISVTTESNTISSMIPVSSFAVTTTTEESFSYVWTLGGDSEHCINNWFSFGAAPGDTITGTITAESPTMVVYLLSDQQYTAWGRGSYCDPRRSTGIGTQWFSDFNTKQATVNWTASISGQYWFVIETFSGNNVVVTVNLSKHSAQTSMNVLYTTQYSTEVDTLSRTLALVTAHEVASLLGVSPALIFGVVIVAVLILVGYAIMMRRRGSTKTFGSVSSSPIFCVRCGSALHIGSKYCRRCGAQQPLS